MDWRRNLLWIDGSGGAIVGILVLIFARWLAELHQLPLDFLYFMGWVNLAYGTYSLTLVRRRQRPKPLIILLVLANLAWGLACLRWAWLFSDSAGIFGMAHLVGEGLFVGGLACLEWRWRDLLLTA